MSVKHRGKIKNRRKMFIHWKSLLAFGIIFWFFLCAFDLFGGNTHGYIYNKDYDLLYETFYMEKLNQDTNIKQFFPKLNSFGFSLLLWNSVTFLCSVLFCYVIRMFWWIFAKSFYENRNAHLLSAISMVSNSNSINKSKIPVKVKQNLDFQMKSSKSNLSFCDASYPSLLDDRTTTDLAEEIGLNVSKSQNIYKNNKIQSFTPTKDEYGKTETYVDSNQVTKLRQEIIKVQNDSLKEQTEMSRKLNVLNREKKDLTKQLTTAQKENRAAKQQIDELAQEKILLMKKLETLSKEVKSNTKSKKLALSKLEDLSNNSDYLKQQLEQVTRDKDILESKLKVLQDEYERLQERIILNVEHTCENTPERDINTLIDKSLKAEKPKQNLEKVINPDYEMKNIQVKIKQLERNLENFNKNDDHFQNIDGEQTESETSLSIEEPSQTNFASPADEDKDVYDFYFANSGSFGNSPRFPYWSNKISPYLRNHTNQSNLNGVSSTGTAFETEREEYNSSQESLDNIKLPQKIVSSTSAFQHFLKNIQKKEGKLYSGSYSDIFV